MQSESGTSLPPAAQPTQDEVHSKGIEHGVGEESRDKPQGRAMDPLRLDEQRGYLAGRIQIPDCLWKWHPKSICAEVGAVEE